MVTNVVKPVKPHFITLDTIAPQEMRWLWHPYIPAGTVTALYGRGGMGKSWLTCDLAARLSRGDCFPDAPKPQMAQKVLMLSAEDDYPTVLVPRLMKLKADLRNIAVPSRQFVLDPKGIDWITDLMADFSATVLFIDPIVYYAGGKMDMNKSNEVRSMMEKLKLSAEKTASSVIIVGHIRKSQEGGDGDQMMGSADWINAARSGLFVTKTNDGTKVMKHSKTNYGSMGLSRSFEITDDGFEWGDAYDEDSLPIPHGGKRKEAAVAFLIAFLKDGPVPAKELEQAAADEDIAPATLNRAKVGIAESVYSKSKGWVWQLIAQGN